MHPYDNLRFYIFDWDDNVLFMDTPILVEQLTGGVWRERRLNTSEYALVRNELPKQTRYRYPQKEGSPDYSRAYAAFNDRPGEPSRFLIDTVAAIAQERFAPSYNCFKEALVAGSLFMICTARAHRPSSLREGVEYVIRDVLTDAERETMYTNLAGFHGYYKGTALPDRAGLLDWYLNKCGFVPISSPEFARTVPVNSPVESAKFIAVERFVSYATGLFYRYADRIERMTIGFSDDDQQNVNAIAAVFRKHLYPNVEFFLYNTSTKTKKLVPVQ